jgi:hypothetical protein
MVGGALHAAGRARLVHPLGGCLGAGRGDHFGTVRGCAYRRSDEAGLSRCSDPAREEPLGALAFARACAVAGRIEHDPENACPGLLFRGGNRFGKDHAQSLLITAKGRRSADQDLCRTEKRGPKMPMPRMCGASLISCDITRRADSLRDRRRATRPENRARRGGGAAGDAAGIGRLGCRGRSD